MANRYYGVQKYIFCTPPENYREQKLRKSVKNTGYFFFHIEKSFSCRYNKQANKNFDVFKKPDFSKKIRFF